MYCVLLVFIIALRNGSDWNLGSSNLFNLYFLNLFLHVYSIQILSCTSWFARSERKPFWSSCWPFYPWKSRSTTWFRYKGKVMSFLGEKSSSKLNSLQFNVLVNVSKRLPTNDFQTLLCSIFGLCDCKD